MKKIMCVLALLFLAGCAQTGYQGSYIITHNGDEDPPQSQATP